MRLFIYVNNQVFRMSNQPMRESFVLYPSFSSFSSFIWDQKGDSEHGYIIYIRVLSHPFVIYTSCLTASATCCWLPSPSDTGTQPGTYSYPWQRYPHT